MKPDIRKLLKSVEDNIQIIQDESFELCKHDEMGISLTGAEINGMAHETKKILEQINVYCLKNEE